MSLRGQGSRRCRCSRLLPSTQSSKAGLSRYGRNDDGDGFRVYLDSAGEAFFRQDRKPDGEGLHVIWCGSGIVSPTCGYRGPASAGLGR